MRKKEPQPKKITNDKLYDLDAEQAVLGSILLDRDAIITVQTTLTTSEAFYSEKHRLIYEAMVGLTDARTPPDLKTVTSWLREREQLELVGGIPYLLELSNATPTATHASFYAQTVASRYVNRMILAAAQRVAEVGSDTSLTTNEVLSQATSILLEATTAGVKTDIVHIGQIVDEFFGKLKAQSESETPVIGLSTGFTDYDKMTGGLHDSDLLILAARPATGKTSLAMNIAVNIAKNDHPVVFFSLEMSREQLLQRIIAMLTGIDVLKLRTGRVNDSDLQLLTDALGTIAKWPLYIDDTPGLSITELRAKARRAQAVTGVKFIAIDYLQLMTGSHRRDGNRVQEVSEISRGLKLVARELNVPVLALSQLSRAVEQRAGSKVPMLSDLRESGSLEQDADMVIFIYREELYDPETDKKGIAELHLAKHRGGPPCTVPLRFFKSTTTFANLETYQQPEGY